MNLVPLSEVCRIVNGGTPKSGVAEYWGGDVAWLTPAEMGKLSAPEIAETVRTISAAGLRNSSAKQVPVGSVIMSTRAPIGHLAIPLAPMAFNQGCRGLVPDERIDTRYLYYFLWFSREALNDLGTGTTFKELSTGALGSYKIPLPPLSEQRRIVAVLDEAFTAIGTATANIEKNLANARELFDRCLADVFETGDTDWIVEPLKANVRFIDYRGKTPPKRGSGVRLITAKNVKMGYIQRTPEEFILPAAYDSWMTRGFPQQGDVLFTTEAPLGNVAQLDTDERVVIGQRLITMQPKADRIDPSFLKYLLRSTPLQRSILRQATGATVSGIKAKLLKEIPISYPRSMSEQLEIVKRLDTLYALSQTLADQAKSKIAHLSVLKQSVLHRAFAGEQMKKETRSAVTANDNFATPEFAAQILAFAHSRHVGLGRATNFGHVKAQKTLHAVEAIGGLDLGRQPIRDAAGPNDFAHMRQAEDWARHQGFFEFVQRANGGYDFRQLQNYEKLLDDAQQKLEQAGATAKRAVELLVDMDSDFAEIVVTTHAAWNNLILDGATITDDTIVQAARDDWHRDKLRYEKSRFHDAIRFIRSSGIEPNGSAKRVGGQESLPL